MARATHAQKPLYPPNLAKAPPRTAPFRTPEPLGLTLAQLRDIIIDQIG
jgi:hypothetical protein